MENKTITFNLWTVGRPNNPTRLAWTKKYYIEETPEMYCILSRVESSQDGEPMVKNLVSTLEYSSGNLEEATANLLEDQKNGGTYTVEVVEDSTDTIKKKSIFSDWK